MIAHCKWWGYNPEGWRMAPEVCYNLRRGRAGGGSGGVDQVITWRHYSIGETF
jgi:hypothetical protein